MTRGVYDRSCRRKPLTVPIEILEEEYKKGMSLYKLELKYGIKADRIRDNMIRRGFKLRSKANAQSRPNRKTGNFNKYPISAYREPPCHKEVPFCIILRDFFKRMDGVYAREINKKERILEMWRCVKYGDPEMMNEKKD